MVEKHSRFVRRGGCRALLVVGALLLCGLSHIYAGNGPSKPIGPEQEIAAIQYNKSGQLRTDFTDNREFVRLLREAYGENVESTKPFKDWRPAARAYHAAFEELKTRLQGKWREIFGDGPSRFPWNGHSDRATDLWKEDDLRRDMPVSLSFWNSGFLGGHICKTEVRCDGNFGSVSSVPNDNKAYVPNNSPVYLNQGAINSGKDKYKAYVLKFFNASSLKECRKYLELFFCAPVSELLCAKSMGWDIKEKFQKEDLLPLLNLYADYYSLDSIVVYNRFNRHKYASDHIETMKKMGCVDDFLQTTKSMVYMLVACYSNYEKWNPEDQKWLCSLLDNLDANYYVKENLHTYCIQSYDLLEGFYHVDVNYAYSSYTGFGDVKSSTSECKGLRSAFKKLGKNPLPEGTWSRFVDHVEKRLAIHRTMLRKTVGM